MTAARTVSPDFVVCPHCWINHPHPWEVAHGLPQQIQCTKCKKPFWTWAENFRRYFADVENPNA